jgi:hypothetical protein
MKKIKLKLISKINASEYPKPLPKEAALIILIAYALIR